MPPKTKAAAGGGGVRASKRLKQKKVGQAPAADLEEPAPAAPLRARTPGDLPMACWDAWLQYVVPHLQPLELLAVATASKEHAR